MRDLDFERIEILVTNITTPEESHRSGALALYGLNGEGGKTPGSEIFLKRILVLFGTVIRKVSGAPLDAGSVVFL